MAENRAHLCDSPASPPLTACPMFCASAPSPRPTAWPVNGSATFSGVAETVARFHRVRNHFGVNRLGQAAALAALEDQTWLGHVIASGGGVARIRLPTLPGGHGLKPIASATNFVTIDCGGDGDRARAILDGLVSRGVFIRMPVRRAGSITAASAYRPRPSPRSDIFEQALVEIIADLGLSCVTSTRPRLTKCAARPRGRTNARLLSVAALRKPLRIGRS